MSSFEDIAYNMHAGYRLSTVLLPLLVSQRAPSTVEGWEFLVYNKDTSKEN